MSGDNILLLYRVSLLIMETENIEPYIIILKFRITFGIHLHQFKNHKK